MERRLAAILAADVVGYSWMMSEDEAGTLKRLKAIRDDLIMLLIASHHGRVVKLIGDGLLVEFSSAVDAVTCAHINARQYDKAVETVRLLIQRRPDYPHARFILAIALGHFGLTPEAQAELEECERLHPGFLASRADWRPYNDEESNRHLHEGLRKAGIPD